MTVADIRSALTVVYDIFRDVRRIGRGAGQQTVVIGAHPHIVEMLQDTEPETLEQLQREFQYRIMVNADPLLPLDQYDIVVLGEGAGVA